MGNSESAMKGRAICPPFLDKMAEVLGTSDFMPWTDEYIIEDMDQCREIPYLLAVGQYRAGNSGRALKWVDEALQARMLKRIVEQQLIQDGIKGIGFAAAAAGLVAAVAALMFKN